MTRKCWLAAVFTSVCLVASTSSLDGATDPPTGAQSAQESAPGLANTDIIRLVQGGIGDALIIARIRQAGTVKFDLSTEAILTLKTAGVSDAVIAAMIDNPTKEARPGAVPLAGGPQPSVPEVAMIGSNDSLAPQAPGIYIDLGTEKHRFLELEPTVFTQAKMGSLLGTAFTYGIKKVKFKAVVKKPKADIRLDNSKPIFFFYFEQAGSGPAGAGVTGARLGSASSPTEFLLLRMSAKKDGRELIVGQFGVLGGTTGPRSDDTVELKIEKLAPGIYRVVPATSLKPGEYCFFNLAGASTLGVGSVGKLFDFGIDQGRAGND